MCVGVSVWLGWSGICVAGFYFTSYVFNMFRTLIYPPSGACDYSVELPHWSYCSWFDVCWNFGVVGLEWYPCCRLKHTTHTPIHTHTPHPPTQTHTPTHTSTHTAHTNTTNVTHIYSSTNSVLSKRLFPIMLTSKFRSRHLPHVRPEIKPKSHELKKELSFCTGRKGK